jgi:hypothetical protein
MIIIDCFLIFSGASKKSLQPSANSSFITVSHRSY